jgi:hypothetical protein
MRGDMWNGVVVQWWEVRLCKWDCGVWRGVYDRDAAEFVW